jgi:hypothetical protein
MTIHHPLLSRLRMDGAIPPLSQWFYVVHMKRFASHLLAVISLGQGRNIGVCRKEPNCDLKFLSLRF